METRVLHTDYNEHRHEAVLRTGNGEFVAIIPNLMSYEYEPDKWRTDIQAATPGWEIAGTRRLGGDRREFTLTKKEATVPENKLKVSVLTDHDISAIRHALKTRIAETLAEAQEDYRDALAAFELAITQKPELNQFPPVQELKLIVWQIRGFLIGAQEALDQPAIDLISDWRQDLLRVIETLEQTNA